MARFFTRTLLLSALFAFSNYNIPDFDLKKQTKTTLTQISQIPLATTAKNVPLEIIAKSEPVINDAPLEIIAEKETPKVPSYKSDNLSSLVSYMSKKGHSIDTLIADGRFKIYENIARRFKSSAEKRIRSFEDYKKALGFNEKKEKIPKFIAENISTLRVTEEISDIPREVIASIIGIESDFGGNKGAYNPFNVYVSMYVKNHKKNFATVQLEELLKFCEKNKVNVFDLSSSYAGATSHAQFLPYSLNKWFIGKDLYNMDNNIRSVGNYLSYFKNKEGSVKEAVFRYNPSNFYVKAVLDLAEEAKKLK